MERGPRVGVVGLGLGKGRLYVTLLQCHHKNDNCIKTDTDDSHFIFHSLGG